MSGLAAALQAGRFVVTGELSPPKGVDLQPLYEKVAALQGCLDGVNVTDSAGANMAMSPLAACHLLLDHGIDPILQMTSRDKNRIAIQGDMLGATALGVRNLVVMGGDPPANGDHPEAKPVFDMFASQIIAAAKALNSGRDMMGNELRGETQLTIGAVVNPGASKLDDELQRMREKIDAGAVFLQTQAIYDSAAFDAFRDAAGDIGVPVLAGIIPLKSVRMAQFLNERVPGITVPDALIAELEGAGDKRATAVDIAARTIKAISARCQGVHIMALGWEDTIPDILAAAGVDRG